MEKIISPDAYDFGMPVLQEIKIAKAGLRGYDKKVFVKRAGVKMADIMRKMSLAPGEIPIHMIAIGAGEYYGCLFAGAPVQTNNGMKSIENITVGDMVLTHKNRYRSVNKVFSKSYTGTRTTIKAQCLPEAIVSTGNHPYWVVRREHFGSTERCPCHLKKRGDGYTKEAAVNNVVANRAEYVSAKDLQKGDFMIIPLHPTIPVTEQLEDDLAYTYGLYLAEGCPTRKWNKEHTSFKVAGSVFVMSKSNDAAVIANLHSVTKARGYKLSVTKSSSSDDGVHLTFYCSAFATRSLALFGKRATNKFLSPVIYQQSLDWKLKFLSGYFDGDGCLIKTANKQRYIGVLSASTASLNLALDVQRLLAGIGIPSSVSKGCNKHSNGCFGKIDHTIYSLSVGSAYSWLLLQNCIRMPKDFKIPPRKKFGSMQVGTEYALVPIKYVINDQVKDITKYNMEVAEDNTYTTLTISHNSNRNQDFWSENACRKYHHTFVKYARFYRSHINKDTKRSYGIIKHSDYNETMHRLELIVALNGTKEAAEKNKGLVADEEMEMLKSGETIPVSMSARVAYDVCMICGNKAQTRDDYCLGIDEGGSCPGGGCKNNMGKVAEDGSITCVDNPHPTWTDISKVWKPADRIAYVFGKMEKSASSKLILPDTYQSILY